MTRAPYEGTIGVNGSLTARVLVSETSGSYTTTYANQNDFLRTTALRRWVSIRLNIIRQTTALCISAACIRFTRIGALRPMTNKFTFNGSRDVMAAGQKSSTKNTSKDGTCPQLTFNHLLTQLVIKAVAEDDAAITAWEI